MVDDGGRCWNFGGCFCCCGKGFYVKYDGIYVVGRCKNYYFF